MVRVLLVSKALIAGAYQRKAALLARMGVDLTVVVPPYWKDDAGRKAPLEQASLDEARLEERRARGARGRAGIAWWWSRWPSTGTSTPTSIPASPRGCGRCDRRSCTWTRSRTTWPRRRPSGSPAGQGRGPSSSPGRTSSGATPRRSGGWSGTATAPPAGAFAGNGEAVEVLRRKGYRGPAWVVPHPSVGVDEGQFYRRHAKGGPASEGAPLHRWASWGACAPRRGPTCWCRRWGPWGGHAP